MAVLEIRGLTKRFGNTTAVHDLTLDVNKGEVFGFLGQNGAGKSTTIDMLLDFIRPTNGTATISGHNPQHDPRTVREHIGILPDDYSLYDQLTGREHIEFAITMNESDEDPEAILARIGLTTASDRPTGSYSKGMRQRLAFGMALIGDPSVLILDEPSTGLDPNGVEEMRAIIREEADTGTTVFFSSHILDQVEAICDRVGIIDDGELIAVDTVEGLRNTFNTRSTLILSVDSVPSSHGISDLEGVENIKYTDETIEVSCTNPEVKSSVIARVEATGASVTDITIEQTSLAELFSKITTGGKIE